MIEPPRDGARVTLRRRIRSPSGRSGSRVKRVVTARRTLQPYPLGEHTVPAGVYVAACLYLAHRREPSMFIPFGGGTRRCLGAAFATLEMREVIRAVNQRFLISPDRPEGERMRRRSVVLAPSRQGSIVPMTR